MYKNVAKCKNFTTHLLPLKNNKDMAGVYRKKGNAVWYYIISYKGKRYQGSTGTTDKVSAKLIAEAKQTDIARGAVSLPVLNKKVINFTILWREYFNLIKNINEFKIIECKDVSAKHFLPFLKNKNINDIVESDIQSY